MRLAVVIPCFNEEQNIKYLVDAIQKNFNESNNIHVFLVNNGSTDDSFAEMQKLVIANKQITIVDVETNKGYGYGIKYGLRFTERFDLICWTHADLQTDLGDITRALNLYTDGSVEDVMIKGRRINRSYIEVLFSFAMQCFASLCLRTYFNEINAQPKLMQRKFYMKHVEDAPDDFSLDLYYLYKAKKNNVNVIEFPVSFLSRIHGEAKGGSGSSLGVRLRLIKRTIAYILKLRTGLK